MAMPDVIDQTADNADPNFLAPNPYYGASKIYALDHNRAKVSWTISGHPENKLTMLFIRCRLVSKQPLSRATVIITASNSHQSSSSPLEISGGDFSQIGVTLHNSDRNYSFSIEVIFSEWAKGGCGLEISPLDFFHPIYDSDHPKLYRISKGKGPSLISCNQGGLMNRLIPLMTLQKIGKESGASVYTWWGKNEHCAADFEDLFDCADLVDSSFVVEDFERHMAYEQQVPVDIASGARNRLVYSITPVSAENPKIETTHHDAANEFRKLSLSSYVNDRLRDFEGIDFSKVIAIHIRRPYPSGAFAEMENSKFTLGFDVFADLIAGLKKDFPEYKHVLLCTNGSDFEDRIVDLFGDYILFFRKQSVDNSSNSRAVQDAVVDLSLMAKCPIIFSQETTAFGFFAHTVASNYLFCVTKLTDDSSFHLWRFDKGVHVETLNVSRTNLSSLRVFA